MSDAYPIAAQDEPGRFAAMAAYALYVLSIPSAALFAPIGLLVAYVGRAGAGPIAQSHLNDQIRLFWVAFAWGVAVFLASVLSWILVIVLIGIPMLWLTAAVGFLVMVWFTVKSVLGFVRLVNGHPA